MTFEHIDRPKRKWEAAELLRTAQVSPKAMTALYMAILIVLGLIDFVPGSGFFSIFISIFTSLLSSVLGAGFVLYCMAIYRGERAEYLTLFDGFSFVGKIILLEIVSSFFILLWAMLFVIPGLIAAYRYRFAAFNLYENPGIGAMEALDMSKRQTYGYKWQLFVLDLSYFGWALLSGLPSALLEQTITRDLTEEMLYGVLAPSAYFGVPILVLSLLSSIWNLLVCLFYYPNFVCVQLSYFETAKRTSGVGQGAEPPSAWDGWNAPDGLS